MLNWTLGAVWRRGTKDRFRIKLPIKRIMVLLNFNGIPPFYSIPSPFPSPHRGEGFVASSAEERG
jgi:hypothetical protein